MGEWTRETPWRQGHLLTQEAIHSLHLFHPQSRSDTVVIVATHDCDLAQHPSIEPAVEVVVGRRIAVVDGNYTHAKTARTLHIRFEGDAPLMAEFLSTAKCSIQKEALAGFEPATGCKLSPSGRSTFQRWLASRYRRSAFPDEFERRLVRETKLAERIAKAVKPHGGLITAVLFDLDEGQEQIKNDPDDVYVLGIILLHAVEPDFDAAEQAAENAKKSIQADFKARLFDERSGQWQKIELRYVDVISEEALTYRQFTLVRPWRLEYLSLGAEPQQPIMNE